MTVTQVVMIQLQLLLIVIAIMVQGNIIDDKLKDILVELKKIYWYADRNNDDSK